MVFKDFCSSFIHTPLALILTFKTRERQNAGDFKNPKKFYFNQVLRDFEA
jgi:hypothetical protein